LPDGLFSNQKSKFGFILNGLQWKILVYFVTIWSILWPFDMFYLHLVYFIYIWSTYFMAIWYILP
jgi:hypothetical protein